MNDTVQLLKDVVRNARTGQDAVEQLMKKTDSGDMREELAKEKEVYATARSEGERALRDAGGEPEPESALKKAGMWAGLEMETLKDGSDDHIAEIVIQGATMGVIEMTRSLNTYERADSLARSLANRFVIQQNDSIERQKAFLVQ